ELAGKSPAAWSKDGEQSTEPQDPVAGGPKRGSSSRVLASNIALVIRSSIAWPQRRIRTNNPHQTAHACGRRLSDGQSALNLRRHGVVDQEISEHRVAEGPADERIDLICPVMPEIV